MPRAKDTIDYQDLKLCNCVLCGIDAAGPSHHRFALQFGLRCASYVLGRPYCSLCVKAALSNRVECCECLESVQAQEAKLVGPRIFCITCAQPKPTKTFIREDDRTYYTKPDDFALANDNHAFGRAGDSGRNG